jgi:hypothetical protein
MTSLHRYVDAYEVVGPIDDDPSILLGGVNMRCLAINRADDQSRPPSYT